VILDSLPGHSIRPVLAPSTIAANRELFAPAVAFAAIVVTSSFFEGHSVVVFQVWSELVNIKQGEIVWWVSCGDCRDRKDDCLETEIDAHCE